jgi:type I restriction enzyme R subunit
MVDISEKNFEATIEAALLVGGPDAAPGDLLAVREAAAGEFIPGDYRRRLPEHYDRGLCLISDDALAFVYATQPKEWEKFKKLHGADARDRLLKRLASEVEKRGTLDVVGGRANWARFA